MMKASCRWANADELLTLGKRSGSADGAVAYEQNLCLAELVEFWERELENEWK